MTEGDSTRRMSFLEARKLVAEFGGGPPLRFLLAASGTLDQLLLYLRAHASLIGQTADPRLLPFNTLAQTLLQPPLPGEKEVFLLLPWDFLPDCDWRSGVPAESATMAELHDRSSKVAVQLRARGGPGIVYLPAPIPPLFSNPAENESLRAWIHSLAAGLGAEVLSPDAFSLATYLVSGCPVASAALAGTAGAVIAAAARQAGPAAKVLVTDLDNVLWSGVIAEDGADGIAFQPEGKGYRHFIYQSFLGRLKRDGVLLAAVSRNDPDMAQLPLREGRMVLKESDFIAVVASYAAKSAQIRELAVQLNLGLESFVFVDDNPIELAEVSAALPQVSCVPFPAREDGLPALLESLSRRFPRTVVTDEDRERTELYRRRLAGMVPSDAAGTDLTEFLRGLDMTLAIHDRSREDRTRAVQLINKTNQFNLNGVRVTDAEVALALQEGARLYGASLEDRHGNHGETLACLVSAGGEITSFVMSCRVFQRRLEYAFLAWLSSQDNPPSRLRFAPTARNAPIQEFLRDPAFRSDGDGVRFDPARFLAEHGQDLALFALKAPGAVRA